jgi:hypothetical protein
MNKSNNIKSNNIKSKLLPINLQSFVSNNFILKSNNINSLCDNPHLFKVTEKRAKLTTEEILRSLDTILFPDTQILEPMMDLYNLNVPNMLILVIFCLILNKKISKRTQKILCEIKESNNEKEMFKLVSRIPYKEFYKFLQKFLCAIKFHLKNLNDYNTGNNSSKKKNKNVEFLIKYIEGSNEIIRDHLVLDENKSGIINLGITTIVYLGYLINNIFYETYINKAPDIDKLRSLMNGNKLLNKNRTSYASVSDTFLFCVYIYDIFNYIVVQILLPNLYKNINLQRGIDPKLFIEYFEYDKALYKKNIVMRHILEMEQKYFKFYKDISFKELLKMNLDKFVLEGSKTKENGYTLKRDLRRSFLNDELFKLTNERFTILDTNQSNNNNNKKNNNNNNNNNININLNNDKIIIKGKKNSGYKFLKCVMTNKGKVDCKNVYNIGFDGREILKIETGENGKTLCSMGYIEQDKKDKNKYSVFFNRPILKDKALKIAEIKLQTAYNKVKIKFTAIYQFLELMIVTFISFRLINGKAEYKSERDRDIPKCVFRRISKNLRLIEC